MTAAEEERDFWDAGVAGLTSQEEDFFVRNQSRFGRTHHCARWYYTFNLGNEHADRMYSLSLQNMVNFAMGVSEDRTR